MSSLVRMQHILPHTNQMQNVFQGTTIDQDRQLLTQSCFSDTNLKVWPVAGVNVSNVEETVFTLVLFDMWQWFWAQAEALCCQRWMDERPICMKLQHMKLHRLYWLAANVSEGKVLRMQTVVSYYYFISGQTVIDFGGKKREKKWWWIFCHSPKQ